MSNLSEYDTQLQAIRAYNQPILDDFLTWLKQSGLSEKTAKRHVNNIHLFSMYLVYYDPLKKLDQATSADVSMLLSSWFPRKVGWTSVTTVKILLLSFKKFFHWLGTTERISPTTVANVLKTLKEGRDKFLTKAADF